MTTTVAEQASGRTLTELLGKLSAPLAPVMYGDYPAFQVNVVGQDSTPKTLPGQPGRYALGTTGLVAEARLEYYRDLGVARQCITLKNESSGASPEINEINVFHLPLKVRLEHAPEACSLGGGLTDGFYPPNAWRVNRVSFGETRTWNPERAGGDRWWTGKRSYSIGSNPEGRSCNPDFPLLMFRWDREGVSAGLWAAMEWSGRWAMSAFTEAHVAWGPGGWVKYEALGEDWEFVFRGGPRGIRKMALQPGETLELPAVNVGVYGSLEEGFNSVRRYVADVISPDVEGGRPHAVAAYSHWFGIHARVTDEILRKQVDRAAELGLEYFEVDAGWYGGSTENFSNGVGNWERVDEKKFPQGLDGFVDYVHSKGLRFGLWFEPERARVGSDWATRHADWFWKTDSGANLHLDLTRREVQDGLIEMLSKWITRLDIRWLRWDNNQTHGPFWDRVDPTGKVQFAYVAGLYRVQDELLKRHPNLMIDQCASGGQRIDFGTLRRGGTTVISDHSEDPHVCRIMQTGGARFLPGNVMNACVYMGPEDGDKAVGPLGLVSRMAGAITLNGWISTWSRRHTRLVKRYLDGFRRYRHLLMQDFYALTPYPRGPEDWDVVQFTDRDSSESVVLAYRVRGDESIRTVRLKRLDPAKEYEVVDPFSGKRTKRHTGRDLMEKGLRLRLEPQSALVRHLKPVV